MSKHLLAFSIKPIHEIIGSVNDTETVATTFDATLSTQHFCIAIEDGKAIGKQVAETHFFRMDLNGLELLEEEIKKAMKKALSDLEAMGFEDNEEIEASPAQPKESHSE